MKQKIIILILMLAVIILLCLILNRPQYYYTNPNAYIEKVEDYSQFKIDGENEDMAKAYLLNQIVNSAAFKKDANGNEKLPANDIKKYVEQSIQKDKEDAKKYGIHYKTYIKKVTGMTFDEYEKTLNENAREIVKQKLVVSYLKKKENIKVTKKDINEFKENYFKTAGISEEDFKKEYGESFEKLYGKNNIRYEILIHKVQDKAYEKVKNND